MKHWLPADKIKSMQSFVRRYGHPEIPSPLSPQIFIKKNTLQRYFTELLQYIANLNYKGIL